MWSKILIFYDKYLRISESKSSLRKFIFTNRNVVLKSVPKWPILDGPSKHLLSDVMWLVSIESLNHGCPDWTVQSGSKGDWIEESVKMQQCLSLSRHKKIWKSMVVMLSSHKWSNNQSEKQIQFSSQIRLRGVSIISIK